MKKILFYMGLVLALLPFITYYYATSFLDLFTNTALLSIWESLTAVTVTLGSVTYLETVIKSHSPILRNLGNISYTIYVIHVIFVVLFQILLENLLQNIFMKFFLVSVLSICLSIIFALLIEKANTVIVKSVFK